MDLSHSHVIELFDSFDNLNKWQPELKTVENLSGKGRPVIQLLYDMDGREVEMIDTIIERDLLDVFSGTYDANGVHNLVENRF